MPPDLRNKIISLIKNYYNYELHKNSSCETAHLSYNDSNFQIFDSDTESDLNVTQ